jgi:hypothetical protein
VPNWDATTHAPHQTRHIVRIVQRCRNIMHDID